MNPNDAMILAHFFVLVINYRFTCGEPNMYWNAEKL